MIWDEWRGSLDGRPAMYIKHLFWLPFWPVRNPAPLGGWRWKAIRIDLHKMVRADDLHCFHTHPAHAIRIVLWGGYVEEILLSEKLGYFGSLVSWSINRKRSMGSIGHIAPSFCHRIDALPKGESYSLWIRGPICADVELRGMGWPNRKAPERN